MTKSEAYEFLPSNLKVIYNSSDVRTGALMRILNQLELPHQDRSTIIDEFGKTVLGLESLDSLSERFAKHVSPEASEQIVAALEEIITEIKQTYVDGVPIASETKTDVEVKTIPPEAREKVTPIRTMADDVPKSHGYGAVAQTETTEDDAEPVHHSPQATVLQRPNVANTPTYNIEADAATPGPAADTVDAETAARDKANAQRWQSSPAGETEDSGQTQSA